MADRRNSTEEQKESRGASTGSGGRLEGRIGGVLGAGIIGMYDELNAKEARQAPLEPSEQPPKPLERREVKKVVEKEEIDRVSSVLE